MNSEIRIEEINLESYRNPGTEEGVNELDAMSFELSSRRTGLSFQRTRMSADRTLMSVIRTSFALIGFGFTIYQFFRFLHENSGATPVVPVHAARNFGIALTSLGVMMLILGIWYHLRFMRELRIERHHMIEQKLVHGELSYPVSMTLIVAVLLLLLGIIAIFSIVTKIGPFT